MLAILAEHTCPCGTRSPLHPGQVLAAVVAPGAGVRLSTLIYGKHKAKYDKLDVPNCARIQMKVHILGWDGRGQGYQRLPKEAALEKGIEGWVRF